MFKGTLHLTYKLAKPAEEVFLCLSDPVKFESVHPVIKKIEPTIAGSFIINEELRFAGIPFRFSYPVSISADPENFSVNMKAKVMHLVNTEITFSLTNETTSCYVTEKIIFNSLLPNVFLLKRVFKKQHSKLFRNIEGHNH